MTFPCLIIDQLNIFHIHLTNENLQGCWIIFKQEMDTTQHILFLDYQ